MDDYLSKPFKAEELDEVLEGLRELQGQGEPDIVTELAEMFLDDAAARLPSFHVALEEDGSERVGEISHTLKGSSGNMGATQMAKICAPLQDAGISHDLEHAPELLDRLEAEFERVRVALEAEKSGVQ